jgi:crotonobetainyl-CoA:carnitine CoA-transferase CaiB-like acyl-CoA transferase
VATGENGRGPLAGLRVIECSTVLAGPYCTMVLADLGADVIKVEPPDGDVTRTWGPPWIGTGANRTAAYYLSINRNKRSIVLDLRTARGADVLRRLLAGADVFVENFRPGGLDRLGFADEDLARINPRLIHAAVSGHGRTGPDAGKPGYDFVAQAVGGLMSITGDSDAVGGHPLRVGIAISDVTTGLFAAIGILASLAGRSAERGIRVDVSLLESTLALLINQGQNAFAMGQSPSRSGNTHPNIVPYQTFETADTPIVVAVGSDRQWPRFCEAIGVPDLAEDPRFQTNADRVIAREALAPLLAGRFAERPAAHWLAALEAADVPCGAVNDVLAAIEAPQARARGMDTAIAHPVLGQVRQVGSPIKFDGQAAPPRSAPPLLGEQTAEILRDLGFSDGEMAAVVAGGRRGA